MRSDEARGKSSSAPALPVAPSLGPVLASSHIGPIGGSRDTRASVRLAGVSIALGVLAACCAEALMLLIALVTNIAFYGRFSVEHSTPAGNTLGLLVIGIPVIGGLAVGLMARFGSRAIRGHGIPETMERVLLNESRIPPRVTLLKPISAAVSIGTGGPFGAEGPIIATGGAVGSLIGQARRFSADERKALLAAGAAAGMAATFGAPVSAVLLAIELLLFEMRARSIIPVAMAATTAAALRTLFEGAHPAFPMPAIPQPGALAVGIYILIGAVVGVASVGVSKAVYAIEDAFERLPIHWMWWPALGTLAVGVCGYLAPRTMGVGYDLIGDMLAGNIAVAAVAWLCSIKFLSWSVSLGSGTSGGTLAPLFIIGGGLGSLLGVACAAAIPGAGVDARVAALVGMAALFAGASRAVLTSVVFAFEATLQPAGVVPLLGGCAASYLVSSLLMSQSIMTERLARRGLRVPNEYQPDALDHMLVRDVASSPVVTLDEDRSLDDVRAWLTGDDPHAAHTGYPVVDQRGQLRGLLTRLDILSTRDPHARTVRDLLRRPPVVVYDDCTLRDAVDHMINHDIGRLPVVERAQPNRLTGILTRSTVIGAHERKRDASPIRTATAARRSPDA